MRVVELVISCETVGEYVSVIVSVPPFDLRIVFVGLSLEDREAVIESELVLLMERELDSSLDVVSDAEND